MDIISLIKKDGEIYGAMIKDGQESYPIMIASLHNPMILDTLLDSGWKIYQLPYDLRKGSLRFSDIPSVELSELNISPEHQQDMYDMLANKYTQVDLLTKLETDPESYVRFNEPIVYLKTREELLTYLNLILMDDASALENVMPLNSFTAPSALFTPEEYFNPDNSKYVQAILKRRHLTLKRFMELEKMLLHFGLDKNHTAKQLVDIYFSWGICGMRANFISKSSHISETIFGIPNRSGKPEDIELRYFDVMKLTANTDIQNLGNYELIGKSAKTAEDERLALQRRGAHQVSYLNVYKKIVEEVTDLYSAEISISYTDSKISYTYNGQCTILDTLEVKSPSKKGSNIPYDYWNLTNEKVKKDLFDRLFLEAIATRVAENSKVDTDASSYRALSKAGLSAEAIVKYILSKYNISNDSDISDTTRSKKSDYAEQVLNGINELKGKLTGELSEEYSNIIEEILDGSINVDETGKGQERDMIDSKKKIFDSLIIAHRDMNIPIEEIYREASKLTKDSLELVLSSNTETIIISIPQKNEMHRGYEIDIRNYRERMARESLLWINVEGAIKELAPKNHIKHKHVGVFGMVFNRLKNPDIENYIVDMVRTRIEAHVKPEDKEVYMRKLHVFACRYLFEAIKTGKIKFSEVLGGEVIEMNANSMRALKSSVNTQYESTMLVSTQIVGLDGTFTMYCDNAVVTPNFVIPRAEEGIIKEYPFISMWLDTKRLPDLKPRFLLINGMPHAEYRGLESSYGIIDNVSIIQFNKGDALRDPMSLLAYHKRAEEYRTKLPSGLELEAPMSWNELLYKKYADIIEGVSEEKEAKIKTDESKAVWSLGTGETISRSAILSRNEATARIFSSDVVQLPEPRIKLFTGLSDDDYCLFGNIDTVISKLENKDTGKIKMVKPTTDSYLLLADKSNPRIRYTEVERLDENKYDVKHLIGRKYLIKDIKNKIWEVTV